MAIENRELLKKKNFKTVAVIISHINSARTIGKCLAHLLEQDYPRQLYQIIVVDAGSADGSVEIVKKMESEMVRQIIAKGASEPEGQSLGIQLSESNIIMFTNSDIYVPKNWIRKHVEWLDKGYDLVGGKVFWGGDKYSFTWNMPTPKSPQFVQQQGLGLGFSNCSFKRDLLSTCGGLSKLRSQHDTEFAFRVLKCGKKMVLDPEIEVFHDHPLTRSKMSFTRSFRYAINHVLVMREAYGRIVSGSGCPAMIPVGGLIREWTLVGGLKTYRELYPKAYQMNIRVGLIEFLLIRLLSTKLGQAVGVFAGAIKPNSALFAIANTHVKVQNFDKPE